MLTGTSSAHWSKTVSDPFYLHVLVLLFLHFLWILHESLLVQIAYHTFMENTNKKLC